MIEEGQNVVAWNLLQVLCFFLLGDSYQAKALAIRSTYITSVDDTLLGWY